MPDCPVMLDSQGMNWQISLPKPEQHFPMLMHPVRRPLSLKIRHIRYSTWRRNLSHNSSSKNRSLSQRIWWPFSVANCPDFAASVIGLLLLSSYLRRIKREFFLQCCGHQLQKLTHLLDCPASVSIWHAIFGTLLPSLNSGPDLGTWPGCGSLQNSSARL